MWGAQGSELIGSPQKRKRVCACYILPVTLRPPSWSSIAALVLFASPAVAAEAWYGGTFEGPGWVLLRVEAYTPTHIRWLLAQEEGYRLSWNTVYFEDGRAVSTTRTFGPDPNPGLYLDTAVAGDFEAAPNWPSAYTPTLCVFCGGSGRIVGDSLPGVYYIFVGIGGEISYWTLDAPRSTLVASGPTHFKWGSHLDGAPFVEANGGPSSAMAAIGPRHLVFDIEHSLQGSFGDLADATVAGSATLARPDGNKTVCPCLSHASPGGPGTYRYEDDRTAAYAIRRPVAFWADVPLPWT